MFLYILIIHTFFIRFVSKFKAYSDIYFHIFRGTEFDNDISVLTLETELTLTDKIVPACLPDSSYQDYVGERFTISGWGRLGSYSGAPDKLQVVKVPYVPNNICGGVETNYEQSALTDNMMCAGNITHGSIDSCQGDSGGNYTNLSSVYQSILLNRC